MDADFIKQAILMGIRWAAAPVISWAVVNFGITEDTATAFIVGAATWVVMFGWGLANKWRAEKKVEVALELPAGSSKETLKDVIATK